MAQELTNYDKQWAEQAQAYAAQEKLTGGGAFFSTRGGVLSIGDETMPGNQMAVVVLDAVMENTYYEGEWDPNVISPPLCYAFGRTPDEMAPHASMQVDPEYFVPQSEDCTSCKHNVWGSALKGRGKACGNRRRLALIPAGYYEGKRGSKDMELQLFNEPKELTDADIVFLKLPPTSVEDWSKYVNAVAANHRRPPHGVITRIWLEPESRPGKNNLHRIMFEMIEQVPDELAQAVMQRHEQATTQIIRGYTVPEEKALEPAKTAGIRGLRGQHQR